MFSKVGQEPTGDPFNADPKWIEIEGKNAPFNPMINAGAILIASMMPEEAPEQRRENFLAFVRGACGNEKVDVDASVFRSETQ